MKLVHKQHGVWDYDDDCKRFLKFLDRFTDRYCSGYSIYRDDGSYSPPSGWYVQFQEDDFYLSAIDLLELWIAKKIVV